MNKTQLIILLLFFVFSCEKAEDYSEIPSIKYKDFIFDMEDKDGFVNKVGYLSFDFVDGDGNLGFYENSYQQEDTLIYDVFIYEFTQRNGNFYASDTENYWLPYFEEGVYRKFIKGDIKFTIYLNHQIGDTIKYNFQIMDRDYHLSNMESTPELIVPDIINN